MATHSSVLAWRTLWTEPGGPQSTGSQKAWGNFFFYNTLTFPCLSCYSSLLLKLHWLEPSSILSYHFLLTSSVFGLRKACFSIFQIFIFKRPSCFKFKRTISYFSILLTSHFYKWNMSSYPSESINDSILKFLSLLFIISEILFSVSLYWPLTSYWSFSSNTLLVFCVHLSFRV